MKTEQYDDGATQNVSSLPVETWLAVEGFKLVHDANLFCLSVGLSY